MPKRLIKDLKRNLFVRRALDQEWALHLAELMLNGVSMETKPKINRDNIVIDGRHRIEAYELNDVTEIDVEIVDVTELKDMIAMAFRANDGHQLPPTKEDTVHVVRQLLELGENAKTIGDALGLPTGIARKLAQEVRSRDERAKTMRAAAAVTEGGLNIAKACEAHGASEEKVREALGGRGRKHKRGIEEMQRGLTQLFKSNSSKIAALMRNLFEKYEDGDVSARQVKDIIEHLKSLLKRSNRNLTDWENRFSANGTGKKFKDAA